MEIAVLITCYNRKEKTLSCLESLKACVHPIGSKWDIYLVDDKSTDGTAEIVKKLYPDIKIQFGDGNLYWAGGMRKAWKFARLTKDYDAYLLLNDDVILYQDTLKNLLNTHTYSLNIYNKSGIYVSATEDRNRNIITYSGYNLKKNIISYSMKLLKPSHEPLICNIANANILFITKTVVDKIGIFDDKYTHGIADYDYTYTAFKAGFPILLDCKVGGECIIDHGKNWLSNKVPLKKRLEYLHSVKGLAYAENIYYLQKHFPQQVPYYFIMYWLKTFFPILWEKLK